MTAATWVKAGEDGRARVLVCLDLQRENLPTLSEVQDSGLLRNCARVLAHARRACWPVVHVLRRGEGHAVSAPPPGLEPLTTEPVMLRSGVSAFSSPDFSRYVRRCVRPELVLIGFSLSSSYLATALVAFDQGVQVTLVEDASGATPLDVLDVAAVETVTRRIAQPYVDVISTDQLTRSRPSLRVVR